MGTEVPTSLRLLGGPAFPEHPRERSLRLSPFPRPCEEACRSEEARGLPRRGQPRATHLPSSAVGAEVTNGPRCARRDAAGGARGTPDSGTEHSAWPTAGWEIEESRAVQGKKVLPSPEQQESGLQTSQRLPLPVPAFYNVPDATEQLGPVADRPLRPP